MWSVIVLIRYRIRCKLYDLDDRQLHQHHHHVTSVSALRDKFRYWKWDTITLRITKIFYRLLKTTKNDLQNSQKLNNLKNIVGVPFLLFSLKSHLPNIRFTIHTESTFFPRTFCKKGSIYFLIQWKKIIPFCRCKDLNWINLTLIF